MFNLDSLIRTGRMPVLMLLMAAAMLSGCKSKQEQALDQAKQQAATTGQAQQVVFCRQERDHNDDGCATASYRAEERSNYDDGDTACDRIAHSSAFGAGGFRRTATASCAGRRYHSCRHYAGDPDRSTHQRKEQPRGETDLPARSWTQFWPADNNVLVPKGARW